MIHYDAVIAGVIVIQVKNQGVTRFVYMLKSYNTIIVFTHLNFKIKFIKNNTYTWAHRFTTVIQTLVQNVFSHHTGDEL